MAGNRIVRTRGRDLQLGRYVVQIGGVDYLATIDIGGVIDATPTIVNVSTTDGTWTAVATGLTGIIDWTLAEENGNDFRYAFVAAPSTYINGFGWVSHQKSISAIYVQRPTATNIDMQFLYWSP